MSNRRVLIFILTFHPIPRVFVAFSAVSSFLFCSRECQDNAPFVVSNQTQSSSVSKLLFKMGCCSSTSAGTFIAWYFQIESCFILVFEDVVKPINTNVLPNPNKAKSKKILRHQASFSISLSKTGIRPPSPLVRDPVVGGVLSASRQEDTSDGHVNAEEGFSLLFVPIVFLFVNVSLSSIFVCLLFV